MIKISLQIPALLDGVHYAKGTHEVPKKAVNNWFFEALVVAEKAIILHSLDKVKTKLEKNGVKMEVAEKRDKS